MNQFILNIIIIIHILFILFIVIVPFTSYTYLLFLHVIICPFIVLHWVLNDNTCALTMAEKYIRTQMNNGVPIDDGDCFTCRIIDPIYKFTNTNADHSTIIYITITVLWLISLTKLLLKFKNGEIKSVLDLAKF